MSWLLTYTKSHWKHRVTAVLWALFLYQYIHWLSQQEFNGKYWLDETVLAVHVSFFTAVVFNFLIRLRPVYFVLLLFIVLSGVQLWALDFELVRVPISSFSDLAIWLFDSLEPLFPYMWFGFGAAFAYVFIHRWADSKARIIYCVVMSIVLFAIIDSFSSTIYLWDQVAIMVLCGLLLLSLQHFSEFRKEYPSSWQYIRDYPGTIAISVVVLIGAVVLAGWLAPNRPPMLKDPYTVWKTWKGEPVQSFGKGFSGVTSLSNPGTSESGYSRHDHMLGGGFNYDFSPVFKVTTTHRSYWRGEVRSFYNGQGWDLGAYEVFPSLLPVEPGEELQLAVDGIDVSLLATETVKQTFTVVSEEAFPVIFGAFAIHQFDSPNLESMDAIRWSWGQQELRWDESLAEYPKTYQIVSEVPVIDPEGLRQASTDMRAELAEHYTQLPSTVPQRVKDLAREVTAEGDNAYDQMKLLEQYLKSTFPYTNRPDVSKGKGEDFVDDFLFEIQEGYCDYYSTAMVVMARSLGIPARWVKGYAPGAHEFESYPGFLGEQWDMIDPDGSGLYTVRNADAHSWVEIYFQGYGWIPFEPTANFILPMIQRADSSAAELPLIPEVPTYDRETVAPEKQQVPLLAIGGALLAVLVIFAWFIAAKPAWFKRWLITLNPVRFLRSKQKYGDNQLIVHEVERFFRFAKRKGYIRYEHETVREVLERWKDQLGSEDVDWVLTMFEKAKYSGYTLQAEDVSMTKQRLEKLRKQLAHSV